MPLKLSFAGIEVTLSKFIADDQPRTIIQSPALEYSAHGTPALQGTAYPAKYLWTINVAITNSDRDLLEALVYEFEEARRNLTSSDILIYDTTSRIRERSPRSRAIVAGTTERLINGGTHSAYFAQFNAVIIQMPKYTLPKTCLGYNHIVTMSLSETMRVPA